MTYRDPKNPAPRGGEGSRSGSSGGRPPRPERDQSRGAGSPAGRPPTSTRPPAQQGRAAGGTSSRSRPAPPPPVSSRTVTDPFAEPASGTRRAGAPTAADPVTVRGRPTQSPPPVVDDPNDPAAWSDLAGDWAEPTGDDWEELPTAEPRRAAPSRRRTRESGRTRARTRPAIDLSAARLPSFAGRADLLGDQVSGILVGASLLSLIVMVIRLATGLGQLPDTLVLHLDAAGIPDGWGPPSVLWRLPLMAGMVLVMSLVVAWFVAPIDRFAARFALAAALGVQFIVWVAVLDFV